MNTDFKYLLDGNFHPSSRVWIYQSNRLLGLGEVLEAEDMLQEFVQKWKSHGAPVKGCFHIFFGQFIILMADESATEVGGCSTDSSVHMIKELEKHFRIQLFDRTSLAFIVKEKIEVLPMNQIVYAVNNGFITPETIYFNNTIQTKAELESNWMIQVKDSWLGKRLSFPELMKEN